MDLWDVNGWKLKVYGISSVRGISDPVTVDPAIVASGRQIAETVFTRSPTTNSYDLGFVIFHEGRLANWLLLDWWADEIQVRQQLFRSGSENPSTFDRVTNDLIACIWELRIVAHEREAWIDTMLKPPGRPDVCGYLERRLADGMY